MAAPTPVTKIFWNGVRGEVRWYAAWTDATNLTDSIVVDVSALAPPPTHIKIRVLDIVLNGNFSVKFEADDVASGIVDTTNVGGNTVTWISGNQFDTDWLGWGNSTITINGTEYVISSVDSATQITLASDPGVQSSVAYSVDEFIDQFFGQTNITYQFGRDYTNGPNAAIVPTKVGSASATSGDLTLTSTGVALGDELSILATFERS